MTGRVDSANAPRLRAEARGAESLYFAKWRNRKLNRKWKEDNPKIKSPLLRLIIWLKTRENQTAFNTMRWLIHKICWRKIDAEIDALEQYRIENKKRRDIRSIEEYRKKFKRVPLGRWNSSFDYGPFSTDTWEFYPDGTGKIFQYSGSGNNVIIFEWQEKSERTIKFRTMDWSQSNDEDKESTVTEDENSTIYWGTVAYDFKVIEHYTAIIVMFSVPEQEMFKFGPTMGYLRFEGDIQA